MSADQTIAIFAGTPGQGTFLAEIIRMAGFTPVSAKDAAKAALILMTEGAALPKPGGPPVLQIGGTTTALHVQLCPAPIHPRQLIEKIEKIIKNQAEWPPTIAIAQGLLETRDNLWHPARGDNIVRLTEKETSILVHLYEAGESGLSRDALLQFVWSYVQGVETHTLETHIYRLRQKIEEDPSTPKIIVTQGDKYILQKA